MSLGILALFITINNPYANMDSLTGLYNHLYLTRKGNELVTAGRSFHIITVYLYQMKHINKIAGIQGGDFVLQSDCQKAWCIMRKKSFSYYGKTFFDPDLFPEGI